MENEQRSHIVLVSATLCSWRRETSENVISTEGRNLTRPNLLCRVRFLGRGLPRNDTERNSHGSLHSKYQYSFVRIGAGLYGYLPEADEALQNLLQPILSLKTKVIGIKNVSAGSTVGYARTYTATKPTKIAVLGMGYFEGINPDLSNTGKVLIHGKVVPIVGRINMNYFTVDVTDVAGVVLHDVATVLGRDGNQVISAYDWRIGARKNVRIFLAQLNPLIPKVVVEF